MLRDLFRSFTVTLRDSFGFFKIKKQFFVSRNKNELLLKCFTTRQKTLSLLENSVGVTDVSRIEDFPGVLFEPES